MARRDTTDLPGFATLGGQLHRGDWMLGGNASFDISKQIGYSEANFGFQAYPKIGYFFTDRIALNPLAQVYRWNNPCW